MKGTIRTKKLCPKGAEKIINFEEHRVRHLVGKKGSTPAELVNRFIKEYIIRLEGFKKVVEVVAEKLHCVPSYSDPLPHKGNAHIIQALEKLLTSQSSKEIK